MTVVAAKVVVDGLGRLGFGRGLAAGLRDVGKELAFGLGPVFEGVAGCAVAVEIELIRAEGDLFAGGQGFLGAGLFGLRRGGVFGCGHGSASFQVRSPF